MEALDYAAYRERWLSHGYAASHIITEECWRVIENFLPPAGHTFEAGSGLSTVLFDAAGCQHVALEHSGHWMQWLTLFPLTTARVIHAPLVGKPPWYDYTATMLFGLVLIDGPPARIGRAGILSRISQLVHFNSVIIVDDAQTQAGRKLAKAIAYQIGFEREYFGNGKRDFIVLKRGCNE